PVPISAAVPLRTVRGTLAELASMSVDQTAWLRVYVRESPRAGLKEEVQDLLPPALEVRVEPAWVPAVSAPARDTSEAARPRRELFPEYRPVRGVEDPAVAALFNEIYEEVLAT